MQLHGKVAFLGFNKKTFSKDIREAAYQTVLHAALEFLLAAAAPDVVPVDTGMARGSFLNLVQFLRARGINPNIQIASDPQRITKKARPTPLGVSKLIIYKHTTGKYYFKMPYSATLLSTTPDKILTITGQVFKFRYETRVVHFNLHDEKWGSFAKGRAAFQRYLSFQKINLLDYVTVTSLSYGRQAPKGYSGVISRNQRTTRNG